MDYIALTLIALAAGVFLAVAFVGVLHALGVALVAVAVVALILLVVGSVRNRRVTR